MLGAALGGSRLAGIGLIAGVENGTNLTKRDISLRCLRAWMSDADTLQSGIDAGKASNLRSLSLTSVLGWAFCAAL